MDTIKMEAVAKPLAKHFWARLEKIENEHKADIEKLNEPSRCIDDLVAKADTELSKEMAKLYKEFSRLPKWLQIYIGNSRKSELEAE